MRCELAQRSTPMVGEIKESPRLKRRQIFLTASEDLELARAGVFEVCRILLVMNGIYIHENMQELRWNRFCVV